MCQQGSSRPYWKPSVKGMLPLKSLIFLVVVYTNCKNAACYTCSENAKGSLCGCVAQTSFWAEMQKKWTVVSSAFPQSARRGRGTTSREYSQYKSAGWFYLRVILRFYIAAYSKVISAHILQKYMQIISMTACLSAHNTL